MNIEPRPNSEAPAHVRTSSAQVHVDSALTDFAVGYENNNFVADLVSPPIYTTKLSGKYFKTSRKDRATGLDDRFGPRGRANEVSIDPTTGTYTLIDRGLYQPVPNDVEVNADAPLDPRQLAVDNVMQRIKLNREIRVATAINTSGNYASANTAAAAAKWTNESTGTPLTDIQTAIQALRASGTRSKKIAVCSTPVYHALAKHPQMMGLRPGGGQQGGMLGADELAKYLSLDGVLVSDVEKNTANEGQTFSSSYVWDSTMFAILLVPQVLQSTDVQIFCASFMLKGGMQVRTWYDETAGRGGSENVLVEYAVDDTNIAMNDRGYLITTVT